MQFANNENGLRTFIEDANEEARYFCPCCGAPMIQRRGQINIPHFAHMKDCLCADNWRYEEMSEWHLSWQSHYPPEKREVVISNDLGCHRADVLINDTVVEFQHSSLPAEEFQARNAFYTACGHRVIWLFDARDAYLDRLTVDEFDSSIYRWKHPPKTLKGLDLSGRVQVFFHLQDEKQTENGAIVRLTWCIEGDLGYFKSASSECYTEREFVEYTATGRANRKADISRKDELFHRLYAIRRKNGETEYCGCPLNADGYAPQIREYSRIACDECAFFRGSSEESVVNCAGRFREQLDRIETVLEMKRIDGAIRAFSFIATDGSIQEAKVEVPESPAASIIELAKDYDAGVLIVRNVRTGWKIKITGDVDEMLVKYSRIYGYCWNDRMNDWKKQSVTVNGPWKPDWIVEWFKTKEQVRQYRSRSAAYSKRT